MRYKTILVCGVLPGVLLSPLRAQNCCAAPAPACVCAVAGDAGRPAGPEDATVVRLGTLEREPVRPGTPLEPGDELTGSAEGGAVEVGCSQGSSVKFSGAFRAVLLPSAGDVDCAFSLLSGGVDIQAGAPTQVRAGLVVMGSKRTEYGLRLAREQAGVRLETMVYEGAAECAVVPTGARWVMETGSKALVHREKWQRARMSRRDIDRTASVNASLEVASARAAGVSVSSPDELYAEMKGWYTKVLTSPSDADARMRLGARQLTLRGTRRALYHLGKAASMAETPQMRAQIAVVQGWAHQELGQREQAARYYSAARQLDPAVDRGAVERSLMLTRKPSLVRERKQAKEP